MTKKDKRLYSSKIEREKNILIFFRFWDFTLTTSNDSKIFVIQEFIFIENNVMVLKKRNEIIE